METESEANDETPLARQETPQDEPQESQEAVQEEVRMSFGDHLEELRRCLIQALIGVGIILMFTLIYGREIAGWITQPLMRALHLNKLPQEVIAQSVTDAFGVYIKVSIGAAIVMGIPWIIYQAWRFVAPGLYEHEKKVVKLLGPASALLTLIAVSFMYTMLLPVSANFLVKWSTGYPLPKGEEPGLFEFINTAMEYTTPNVGRESAFEPTLDGDADTDKSPQSMTENPTESVAPVTLLLPRYEQNPANPVEGQIWFDVNKRTICLFINGDIQVYQPAASSMLRPMITLSSWVNFVVILAIGVSIGFQLPILMLVIGWSKAVSPDVLARGRRYAAMGIFIASAILTPADPISMVVLAIPMCLLFELGLVLMRKSYGDGVPPMPEDN